MRLAAMLAALGIVVLACDTRAAETDPKPDPSVQAIARYLDSCEAFGFSGVVLVAKDGKVLLEKGYGMADRAGGIPNGPDTRFEIASASKQFTAAAVLKLVAAGKVGLDDSAAKWLPEIPEQHKGVTVRHLLHHTSGFPRMGNAGGGPDLGGAVAAYTRGPRTAEPGKRFEYWNGGYALLAGIVERAGGVPFQEFVRKELFVPAGLASTCFCADPGTEDPARAHGYTGDKDDGPAGSHSFGWEYKGMGGVVTTAGDLYRWDRALRGETVLSAAMRKEMFAPGPGDYGCGWYVVKNPVGRVAQHGGTVAGFETQMIRCLDRDAAVFVLANRRDVGWQVGYQLAWMLTDGGFTLGRANVPPPPPETTDAAPEILARRAGRYSIRPGATVTVRVEGRGLLVSGEGQEAVDLVTGAAPDKERHRKERDLAAKVVAALGKGDVEPLKAHVADAWWAKTWPDTVQSSIWPRHVEKWGALKSSEEIGARTEGANATRIWIRLRHEKGDTSAEVVLRNGRLEILDFNGRAFPVSAVYRLSAGGKFVAYDFGRAVPPPFEFAEGPKPASDALKFPAAVAPRAQ